MFVIHFTIFPKVLFGVVIKTHEILLYSRGYVWGTRSIPLGKTPSQVFEPYSFPYEHQHLTV